MTFLVWLRWVIIRGRIQNLMNLCRLYIEAEKMPDDGTLYAASYRLTVSLRLFGLLMEREVLRLLGAV